MSRREYVKPICMKEMTLRHYTSERDEEGIEVSGFIDPAICLVLRGNAAVTEREETTFGAGTLFYVPAGRNRTLRLDGYRFEAYVVTIKNNYPEVMFADHALQVVDGISTEDARDYLSRMESLLSTGKHTDAVSAVAVYYSFYARILPNLREADGPRLNPVTVSAMEYIKEHCEERLSAGRLSGACNISYSRLAHLFSEELHMTPTELRNKYRIEKAMKLLRSTDDSVMDIGARCGFSSPAFFGKVFREVAGVSPGAYREKK